VGIAQWQIEMAARRAPAVVGIVESSTPVVSFGDPLRAEVATLGINPSRREFFSRDGVLLSGPERRLATADSLGAMPSQSLTAAQASQVVADCNDYFHRNPYEWFKPLEALLNQALDVSYHDRTACHLDLIQWATDPVWGKLSDPAAARLLLAEGSPHLERLLSHSGVRLVLLNGATAVRQVTEASLAQLHEVSKIPVASTTCRVLAGEGRGISYLGWSTNLQAGFGVSNEFKQRLAHTVRELAAGLAATDPGLAQAPATASRVEIDSKGLLPHGLKVNGKQELADLLMHWYRSSSAQTIGDARGYGGTAWVTVGLDGHEAVLNADTKRAAVAAYLEHVRQSGPELPWRATASSRGTVNKVVFSDDPAEAAGWYLYLRKPLEQPQAL
jgi:hypothetical protein